MSQDEAPLAQRGPGHKPAAVEVLRQFRQVFNAVKAHYLQVEKQAGMGGAQVWALSVIAAQPGLGVGDLARALDIHQSTASNLLRSLVDRGCVSTERDGQDRRALHLHLMPAGRAVLDKVSAPFDGVLPHALDALDEATLARLRADLACLLDVLCTKGRGAKTPLADL